MRKGRKVLAGVVLAMGACGVSAEEIPLGALPLETEGAACVGKGVLLAEAHVEYLKTPAVPHRYFEGRMLAAPVVSARYGIAENVELGAAGAAQLWAFPDEERHRNEVGDFSLQMKWAALTEQGRRPALGFSWGVKLPNASDESGLGSDETDVFARVLVSRSLAPRWRATLNAGLAILGDPTEARAQNDVFTYALALTRVMGERAAAMAELEGASGKGHAPPESNLRLGLVVLGKGHRHYFAAVAAGLTGHSPDWGVRAGMGTSFGGTARVSRAN